MLYIKNYIEHDKESVVVTDTMTGDTATITNDTKNYDEIVDEIMELINLGDATIDDIKQTIESLTPESENATIRKELGIVIGANGEINLPDGITLPKDVAGVFREITSREQAERLIKFAKRLAKNPHEHARASLIEWIISNPSLSILEDGRIRGFRGNDQNMRSIHSGYGIVNGVEVNEHLDNSPGNIIEFPRHMADHNPDRICSVGIHVGTKKYAYDWGNRWVTVAFAPEDVISFPGDGTSYKIRVVKLEVLEEVGEKYMRDYERP